MKRQLVLPAVFLLIAIGLVLQVTPCLAWEHSVYAWVDVEGGAAILSPAEGRIPMAMRFLGNARATRGVAIHFHVESPTVVGLALYNAKGELVKDWGNHSYSSGTHLAAWQPNEGGSTFAKSGVYMAVLRNDGHCQAQKMVLVK